ncbi:hypothetical protein LSUE1_G003591 [Lachnellula suecica]|uniref:Uncharacterized protein n=1 Tax=Lachnellula suecica TaxID=602035 RepID=A0A8T9C9G8_9HELO|nr:hypothetical protein LSUE1_G003591 [Lachnellula suecica]
MSGFEVAGVVLGGFPLVIEALKFYAEERGVIKDFFNYQSLIQSLLRQLKREKVTFENSTKCLFYAAIKESDRPVPEVVEMMQSPEDSRWSEEESQFDGIFSHKIAGFYAETRRDLEHILTKMQISIEKVPSKQPNKHTTRRQWERLMLAVKQDQLEIQLSKAEKLNRFLIDLTRDNVMSSMPSSTNRTSKHYQPIRDHAIRMAEALSRKLLGKTCHCNLCHAANLKLEVRSGGKIIKSHSFDILFTFDSLGSNTLTPWTSREIEIRALEEAYHVEIPKLSTKSPSVSTTPVTVTAAVVPEQKRQIQGPSKE